MCSGTAGREDSVELLSEVSFGEDVCLPPAAGAQGSGQETDVTWLLMCGGEDGLL